MHPIERLRYVARASGADQAHLVRETAQSLSSFHRDPPALVAACRRIVDRHPTSGALWWICATVLTAPDPREAAWEAVERIETDPTLAELAHGLPEDATACVVGWPEIVGDALPRRGDVEVLAIDSLGEGSGLVRRLIHAGIEAVDVPPSGLGGAVLNSDIVLLEAVAAGPEGFVAVSGSLAAAATARYAEVPVWVVCGVGRLLPAPMWEPVAGHFATRGADPWDIDEEIVPFSLVDQVCTPAGLTTAELAVGRTDCPIAPELFAGGSAPGTFRG